MNDSLAPTPTLELYERLPTVYRLRDADLGYPLRSLLAAVAEQARLLKISTDDYYDDLFVETTDDEVLPYIGDLVANQPLHPIAQRRRPDVARTLHYRRRKGTVAMLTELARDVTGWSSWVEEFFERLGWNQHLEHYRPQAALADLHSLLNCDRAQRAFDRFAHTCDVRAIAAREPREGWHNLRNIGFFVWRLGGHELSSVPAARAAAPNNYGYHFSPLGAPLPLWSKAGAADDLADAPLEAGIAAAIRKTSFFHDLRSYNERYGALPPVDRPPNSIFYGPERSLRIYRDGTAIEPWEILCKNLVAWARPPAGYVGVDVERGRITFAIGEEPAVGVDVDFNYGAVANIGGGPYDRTATLGDATRDTVADPDVLGNRIDVGGVAGLANIAAALTAWTTAGAPPTVIQIGDNRTYAAPAPIVALGELVIQAANGFRPLVQGTIEIQIPDRDVSVTLDGLLIASTVRVTAVNPLQSRRVTIRLRHCTLVPGGGLDESGDPLTPGSPSLVVVPDRHRVRVELDSCIAGAIRMPEEGTEFAASDTVLDALDDGAYALAASVTGTPGAPAQLERCTVLGAVHVRTLVTGSESIFTGTLTADRRQQGCLRFSYTPPASSTPRRFRCQPELAADLAEADRRARNPTVSAAAVAALRAAVRLRLVPAFTSRRYGRPAYAQLSARCAPEIPTGAEDGAEMGGYNLLKQPHRRTNLHLRLEEYMPFGLEAGLIPVN